MIVFMVLPNGIVCRMGERRKGTIAWEIIYPGRDAHVSQYYKEQNFAGGAQGILFCGQYQGEGDIYRSYIYFPVEVLGSLNGICKRKAFLRLFVYRNDITNGALENEAVPVSSRWTASQISWLRQPSCPNEPRVRFLVPAGWQGLMIIDITTLFRGWISREYPNFGLMLKGDETRHGLIAFHGGSYPYQLTVPAILASAF